MADLAQGLAIDEAATYLNVPARWVAEAIRQRKVRCTRIGKHIRFRVEHLDELVAAGEQPVTSCSLHWWSRRIDWASEQSVAADRD